MRKTVPKRPYASFDIRSPGLLSRRVSTAIGGGWHLSDQPSLRTGTLDALLFCNRKSEGLPDRQKTENLSRHECRVAQPCLPETETGKRGLFRLDSEPAFRPPTAWRTMAFSPAEYSSMATTSQERTNSRPLSWPRASRVSRPGRAIALKPSASALPEGQGRVFDGPAGRWSLQRRMRSSQSAMSWAFATASRRRRCRRRRSGAARAGAPVRARA